MTCDQRRHRSIALMNQGINQFSKGSYAGAVRDLKSAVAEDPSYVQARYNLAKVYQKMGRWEAAQQQIAYVVESEPNNAQAHYLLGQCYQNLGQLPQARSAYLKALESKPKMYVAHYRLGTIAEALDRPIEADASYRQAIRINPRFASVFVNLGYLYLDHDYPEEAMQVLKAGVAINGDDASLHNALGMAYNLLKQYDQAIPHFEKAMQLKADLWVALYNIGVSYAAVDKRKQAEAALSRFARAASGRKDIDQAYVRAAYDKIAELRDEATGGQSVPPSRIR